jgi:hypothetical protein
MGNAVVGRSGTTGIAPTEGAELPAKLAQVDNGADNLVGLVAELEKKLASIMAPESSQDVSTEAKLSQRCEFGVRLNTIGGKLEYVSNRLHSILDRLQL